MLNTNQLAKATNLAAQTIYTYVKDGTITPTQVGPNGGYFFSEDIVCELLLRQAAPKMKNSILTIKFAKDTEDFEKFEEAFDEAIAKTSSIRVDDISAYIKHLQERTQVDYMYNRVFLALFAVTAIKECESKTEKLQTQVQAELFQYGNIEDFNSAIACLNNKIHGIKDDNITLSEKDERAVDAVLLSYRRKLELLRAKYRLDELEGLSQKLKNKEEVEYTPSTRVLQVVWRKAEQKFFRDTVNTHIKENLSKGYHSLLGIIKGDNRNTYKLIHKADSNEYKHIEIYGIEHATPWQVEVIEHLQTKKSVEIVQKSAVEE